MTTDKPFSIKGMICRKCKTYNQLIESFEVNDLSIEEARRKIRKLKE